MEKVADRRNHPVTRQTASVALDHEREELLERVEDEVKADFSVGVIGIVDVAAGRVDDIAAMWNVRVARKAAWTNAEVL